MELSTREFPTSDERLVYIEDFKRAVGHSKRAQASS